MRFLVFGIFASVVVGCVQKTSFQHHFEQDLWLYRDSLQFEWDSQDPQAVYRIELKADLTEDFAYTNFYVRFKVAAPDGQKQESLTNFVVASPNGEWVIPETWSGYSAQFILNDSVRFEKKGKYTFGLVQYLREDSLKGIRNLELIIAKR